MKLDKLTKGSGSTSSRSSSLSRNPVSYFAALTSWGRNQERKEQNQQQQQHSQHHSHHHHHHNVSRQSSYDEDPGMMSEVETASSGGFRRQTRARASLPIIRSQMRTQDRSLGLVFLQFKNETKRAFLPNEITTLHTVKALFVRAFPRTVTLNYLDARNVRIYIHDPTKDMFYELEDVKDVKDRSVLRVYEQDLQTGTWQPVGGIRADHPVLLHRQLQEQLDRQRSFQQEDPSYFSEPEFDTEPGQSNQSQQQQQNQQFHRSRRERASFGGPVSGPSQPVHSGAQSQYYGTIILPHQYRPLTAGQGSTSTLSRAAPPSSASDRGSKPFPGYSQTMPRGISLSGFNGSSGGGQNTASGSSVNSATKSAQQRSVSPDLVSKRQLKEQVVMVSNVPGAPPKPQRSFTALIGRGGGGHQVMGPSGPGGARGDVVQMSPSHGNGGGGPYNNHSLPDRPFSVAGQYPPERRSFPDYSGYLSSPDHRPPPNGGPAGDQRVVYGPQGIPIGYVQQRPGISNTIYGETTYNPYGTNARPASVAGMMSEDAIIARQKMESMERQLANLTGLVQGVLQPIATGQIKPPHQLPPTQLPPQTSNDGSHLGCCSPSMTGSSASSRRRLLKEEKSVSFSGRPSKSFDDEMHSPLNLENVRPAKSAIKRHSSAEASASSEKNGPSKPAPPPKPMTLFPFRGNNGGIGPDSSSGGGGGLVLSQEMCSQLKELRWKARDLKSEISSLKKLARHQSVVAQDSLRDTCDKIKATISFLHTNDPVEKKLRMDRLRLTRDEDTYRGDVSHLNKDLTDLETRVEELRSNVINRRCRVNMVEVEDMAQVLSRATKVVSDLKLRYPHLQDTLRSVMQQEMQVVVREEKFLKEEPEKLEIALRRCKKLTGTLVTLKRLASVQEQKSTATSASPSNSNNVGPGNNSGSHHLEKASSADPASGSNSRDSRSSRAEGWRRSANFRQTVQDTFSSSATWKGFTSMPMTQSVDRGMMVASSTERKGMAAGKETTHTIIKVTPATPTLKTDVKGEAALDALLNELQTFSKPSSTCSTSSSSAKKPAPPPPPRSSSRVNDQQAQQLMLLSSLTAAALASARNAVPGQSGATVMRSNSVPASKPHIIDNNNCMNNNQRMNAQDSIESVELCSEGVHDSNSSLASIDSQNGRSRQQLLEDRHQELLRKQKLLQDQYTQLQLLSRGGQGLLNDLKKTGSESNIVSKSGIGVNSSGSLSQLIPGDPSKAKTLPRLQSSPSGSQSSVISNGSRQHIMGQTNGNQSMNNNPNLVQVTNNNQQSSSSSTAKHVETQKIYETDIL